MGSMITSRQIAGSAVYDARGRKMGRVRDLMFDPRTGRVAYAVLAVGGGPIGIGARRDYIPWRALNPLADG